MTITKTKRHIPSRYITYKFVCRECGESGIEDFDKFTDPKNRMDIYCQECLDKYYEEIYGNDDDCELPF